MTAKDTYTVEEAAVKSGEKVQVRIAHIFEGTDVSYVEDFEIDRNDVITINSIAALGNATQPGYASLYYNTDEAHQMGYWVPWDQLEYNARYVISNWNCGTSYEISYKDGKNHKYDDEVIYMTYNYTWVPQKVYKTYNTPVAPEELTNPGEARELVDVPELYTPEYQEFVQKLHVEAQLEAIEEADILDHIAAPVKAAYMEILSHMGLFEVPVAEDPADNEEPAAPADDDEDAPVIPASTDSNNTPAAPIGGSGQNAPAAADQAAASTAAISNDAALMSLLTMILYFTGNREDDEEESEQKRHGLARALTIIPAIAAIVIFFLTENMANPMRMVDDYTLLMAVLFTANVILAVLSKKTREDQETEQQAVMAN